MLLMVRTNSRIAFFLMLLAGSAAGVAAQTDADAAAHQHHASDALVLQLDDGARWASDESLRQGMSAIRGAFQARLPEFRNDTLQDSDYQSLADEVQQQLNFMFRNCDLPPAADAELHKLLAFITGAANGLQDQADRRDAMISLHRALDLYALHFEHPGWGD